MEQAERDWKPPNPRAPALRVRSRLRPSARLREELAAESPWQHAWSFGAGARARNVDRRASQAQEALAEVIEEPVREAFALAETPTALDLGCGEGWLALRLLDWGAEQVLGADADPTAARRAALIAHELRAPMRRLEFREVSHPDWRAARLGRHDVVVCRRGIGEIEDPIDLVRRCARMTSFLFVLDTPLRLDQTSAAFGAPDVGPGTFELRGGEASNGGPSTPLAPVPDRAAVAAMLRAAGFRRIEEPVLPIPVDSAYATGERGIFIARAETRPQLEPADV